MPRPAASRVVRMCTGSPSKKICPWSAWCTPAMQRVSTDLPAPLSPQSPVTCPAGRSRFTWYSACTGPKCLSIPRSFNSGSAGADAPTLAAVSVASDTSDTPGLGSAPREHVDQHRDQQHAPREDVLQRCRQRTQRQQRNAVRNPADEQAAEEAVDRLPAAAEEARPT